jgi:phosphotransferase system HPr (HPr) family protein
MATATKLAPSRCVVVRVEITGEMGLHSKPSTDIAQAVYHLDCEVTLTNERNGNRVDGKRVMQVITLEGYPHDVIQIEAEGPDAMKAIDAIYPIIGNKIEDKEE